MEQDYKKQKSTPSPLHSCSELPSNESKEKGDCLNNLENYYNNIGFLGNGTYGVTIFLQRDEHKLAIKIFEKNEEGINEIKIACRLNELKDVTSIFTFTHGWVLCQGIPKEWNERIHWDTIPDYNEVKKIHRNVNLYFLYLVMNMNPFKFSDLETLIKDDLMKILFMLAHGLLLTRTIYPFFRHADISKNNIMIDQKHKGDVKLTFPDKVTTVTLKNVCFLPKLIDYGLSKFEDWDKKDKNYDLDIDFWENDFKDDSQMFDKQHDIFRVFFCVYNRLLEKYPDSKKVKALHALIESDMFKSIMKNYTNFNDMFINQFSRFLLKDELFSKYITVEINKKQTINNSICSYCNNDSAKWRYDHSEDYLFCSKKCANVFEIFKNYFPVK
jgi:serine/threonine protein kinase